MPEKAKETGWQAMVLGAALAVAASIISIAAPEVEMADLWPMFATGASLIGVGAPYRAARAKQKELQPHVDAIAEDVQEAVEDYKDDASY